MIASISVSDVYDVVLDVLGAAVGLVDVLEVVIWTLMYWVRSTTTPSVCNLDVLEWQYLSLIVCDVYAVVHMLESPN